MGDLILGPVVNATVSKVIAIASDQLNLALGWNEDLQKFCSTMRSLQGLLQDADEKNVSGNLALKSWLQDLRAIADEANDLLEEVAYENMRRQMAVQKSKVRYFFTQADPQALLFRQKMANKIKSLNKRLAGINLLANQLGLQYKLANAGPEPRARVGLETHSLLPSPVFGREEDVSKIVSLLVDSSSQHDLSVMTIVGMPGLGKTTLAKAVLENGKICEHFGDNKMWVCVSENFDVKKILMEMLESITKSSSGGGDIGSKDTVLRKIQEKLGEKSYLLILDDVWNEERQIWEDLRNCLLGISKNKGSRVLVTTRLENVASLMAVSGEHICRPRQLNEDECWTIIKQRAFGDNSVPEGLEGIGKQVAKRCKGVPLVASIIGATLQNKRDKKEWQAITENCVWDSLEKENRVLDIIKFSYDRLPKLALKQCFAFCSIFPKDFVMGRGMLIKLWMAQGFLESSEESCMAAEEIGDKYFKYLLSYSLFQEERRNHVTGSVISCKMHDLIHDFAQFISNFETLIVEEQPGSHISHHVRHLNLIGGREMVPTILGDVAKKLQTLFSKYGFSSDVQVDLKRLRVLKLDDASDAKQLPTCFGNSKSLRYLDISRTQIEELPKFITKLYNLQTFRFTNCNSLKMPPGGIGDLINLRYIHFSDEERLQPHSNVRRLGIEGYGGRNLASWMLKSSKELLSLNNLVALSISNCGMLYRIPECLPSGLSSCIALEELEIWKCSNLVSIPEELKQLRSLVKLDICECPKLKFVPSLEGLVSLKIVEVQECDGLECLPSELSSCIALEELKIGECSNLVSIPEELKQLQSLVKLDICECPKLKFVPSLEGLVSLKTVKLKDCGGLECLPTGLSSCTALEELKIWNCCNLVSIPEELKQLRSLVKLDIWECRKLRSFPEEILSSLASLKTLGLGLFPEELEEFPNLSSTSTPASLEVLRLGGWGNVTLPHQIQRLITLRDLTIESFNGVEEALLGNLSFLKTLTIKGCTGLRRLSSGLLSLERLRYENCPNLVVSAAV
ncbi:hypothetical protein SLEP1_g56622 [Rubroshorea leprosula]|uniref:Disease resistance protein RGA3 n=1 Tax=Rubroshorea leprosula TaxID=152421 RepID=A0AAV5MLL0_9ROSI|nr:hypothetical protein SLEP1_g56622 [Rubroshorea leprosula]